MSKLALGATITTVVFASTLYFRAKSSRLQAVKHGDAIVVTGTSTGIGKHAALSLAREGYTVFACVRKPQDGEALIDSAKYHGVDPSKIKILILDVTNPEQIARGVETVAAFVGERGLKGLFNNAGIGGEVGSGTISTSVEFTEMDAFHNVMNVNFFGAVQVTKAFLTLLKMGHGRIIMNTSVAGFMGIPFFSPYCASKHALEGFSDSLRREVHPLGVKVSILECGFIATPIMNGFIPSSKEPYVEFEQTFWRAFWKDGLDAPTPKVSSKAVIHAMRAKEPKVRYLVGKDAPLVQFLGCIPGGWADYMLRNAPRKGITDQELELLSKKAMTEFPL